MDTKLDKLIAAARRNPAKLQPITLSAVNKHLAATGQPLIHVQALAAPALQPVVWGRPLALSEIGTLRTTGHATAAPPPPSVDVSSYQRDRLAQAQKNEAERNAEKKPGIIAGCFAR